MPRYVILLHDHPHLHFDLLLENGPVLKTWRLPRRPQHPGEILPAHPLGDHRLMYLDYEGPVSGNRGTVQQVQAGFYRVLEGSLESDDVLVMLEKVLLRIRPHQVEVLPLPPLPDQ